MDTQTANQLSVAMLSLYSPYFINAGMVYFIILAFKKLANI